ncbi:D-alanyl-D-alanine carboxypeptidase/D-alanyl-D-alanine-endopeptidase [soil metagenome]
MKIQILMLAGLVALHGIADCAPLDARIQQLISDGAAKRAIWGIYAEDSKGVVLADVNATRLFLPASNRKLVTAALVTSAFKADDTITTELRVDAMNSSGVVTGDLVLHGAGDPSWEPDFLNGRSGTVKITELAKAAKAKGLTAVEGDLVVDTSLFNEASPTPPGWGWDQFGENYASQAAVLSINDNLVAVAMNPGGVGQPVRVTFPIGVEGFEVDNDSTTLSAGSAPTLAVERDMGGKIVRIKGGMPSGIGQQSRAVPTANAPYIAARLLQQALEKEGIRVAGKIVVEPHKDRGDVLLAETTGAPVAEILKTCLEDSNNFLAESLYLLSAAKTAGRGSYTSAHQMEDAYWKRIKVDPSEIRAADGSGLSRESNITPHALVELLQDREKIDWFVDALPVSGKTGTLRYRLSQNGMAGRVHAKTGTIDGVSALSGYVQGNSGKTIYFSIMANNYTSGSGPIRAKIDDIVEMLASR